MSKRTDKSDQSSTEQVTTVTAQSSLPSYLEAALRISGSRPTGAPTTDTEVLGAHNYGAKVTAPNPGIMTLGYVPTLGYSGSANSAVNRAAFSEFNKIRSKISGNRPYEPADHMIYRMAVDSLRDLYLYMSRIYKILSAYSATNLYTPRAIVSSMGLDFDSWRMNAAALFQWLQNHESALRPFPTVPIGNITERHNIYNSYIFHDGEIEASQYYILNQKAFWSYEVVDEVKGLTPRAPGATFDEFCMLWDDMYAALQNSSDVYIIAADIRRAFEDACITELTAPAANDTVEYVKLDSVLTSIMNANICPSFGSSMELTDFYKEFRIEDHQGWISCVPKVTTCYRPNPEFDSASMVIGTANLNHVNMVMANPSAVDYLAATRFKPVVNIAEQGTTVVLSAFGTEVITDGVIVCSADISNPSDATSMELIHFGSFIAANKAEDDETILVDSMKLVLHTLGAISKFDWHPPVVTPVDYNYVSYDAAPAGVAISGSEATDYRLTIVEDVQNYVPITHDNLKNIHEANILAEFGF